MSTDHQQPAGVREPPIVIPNRKELTYLLCQAAELEHALTCEYLYAAFSLKQRPDERLRPEQLEAVERWRRVILGVATQEMLHWALVNNLLTAVGSAPYVSRPHLPHRARGYPAGVQFELVAFGERALRHFLYLERPEGVELEDAEGFEVAGEPLMAMAETDIVPWGQEWATVGHLYRAIEQGLDGLAARLGEDGLFIGPERAQATSAAFGWPDLHPVVDLASAHAAIDRIVVQGEGCRGDWTSAHYGQFLAVLDEYLALRAADPAFEPAHPAVPGGVRPVDGVAFEHRITDPVTAAVTDLFNAVYDLVLQLIVRYFAAGDESDAACVGLAQGSVALMFGAIKPLGLHLATLPLGPELPGATAGPNFQLAYRSSFLLPHRRAAWIRFVERLDELAAFAERIDAPDGTRTVLRSVATALRALMVRLSAHID
jgi:hypothetical protein